MSDSPRNSRLFLALGGILFALLLAAVVTLGSLRVPYEPGTWGEKIVLFAVNTFIVAALLVFGLILGRALVRLWVERRAEQLGSRFKTKMVLGAMAVSLFPLVFLFFISYALMNRTLNRWFPQELVDANSQALTLLAQVNGLEYSRLQNLANRAAASVPLPASNDLGSALVPAAQAAARGGAEGIWGVDASGSRVKIAENFTLPIVLDPGTISKCRDPNSYLLGRKPADTHVQTADSPDPLFVHSPAAVCDHVVGALSFEAGHSSHTGAGRGDRKDCIRTPRHASSCQSSG